jgi:hypothetical protein
MNYDHRCIFAHMRTPVVRRAHRGAKSFVAKARERELPGLPTLRRASRSVALPTPISATRIPAEIAETYCVASWADHSNATTISLLASPLANLQKHPIA